MDNLTGPGDKNHGQWDCPFCPNGGPDPDTGARVHVDQGHVVMACSNCHAQVRFGSDILRKPDLAKIADYPALVMELYGTEELSAAASNLIHAEAEGDQTETDNAKSVYATAIEEEIKNLERAAENDLSAAKRRPALKGMSPDEVDAKIEAAITAARKAWDADQKKKSKE